MSTRPIRLTFGAALLLFGALASLTAQNAASADRMNAALQLRSETTAAVVAGKLLPEEALARLHAAAAPMGLGMDGGTEYALAVMDLGLRLLASHQPAKAETFFIEAENALGAAIQNLPDSSAADKAMRLEHRAFIRSNFLNKTPEADADLAQAIALQPENKKLQRARDSLPAVKAGRKADNPKIN